MGLGDELSNTLGKHSIWKGKIKKSLTKGNESVLKNIFEDYHTCDFCKWLYTNHTVAEFKEC
jgi:hypothetical protein